MKNCILLFSGGLDSTVAIQLLMDQKYTVYPLFIEYGQKAEKEERKAVNYFCRYFNLPLLKVVKANEYRSFINHPLLRENDFDGIVNSENGYSENYLPCRNLLFSTIATIYCAEVHINHFSMGFTKKKRYDKFPDTSPQFVHHLNGLISIMNGGPSISMICPSMNFSKKELVQFGIERSMPIHKTYSCYNEKKCGSCESCLELKKAFQWQKKKAVTIKKGSNG